MILIAWYVLFMVIRDVVAYLLGLLVERKWGSEVSLVVFLVLYFLSLWIAGWARSFSAAQSWFRTVQETDQHVRRNMDYLPIGRRYCLIGTEVKRMRYVVRFMRRVLGENGHEAEICQKWLEVDARNKQGAVELAKRAFCASGELTDGQSRGSN